LACLLRKLDTTVLCVTHEQEEIMLLADQLVVLDRGRVVQAGSPLDLYRRPATPVVASCLGEANLVDVMVEACDGGPARTPLGRFPLPPGPLRGWLLVRPEDVTEDAGGAVATVLDVREMGPHDRVVFGLEGGAEVLAHLPPNSAPEAGRQVRLGVRRRKPHFLAEG
jgi:ABC-type sugar transport system ATPase subunit